MVLTRSIVVRGHSGTLGGDDMASTAATEAYENLTFTLAEAEGVAVTDDGLLVHGKLFAYLEGDDLVVELPLGRADDLIARGVAKRVRSDDSSQRDWVRIDDEQLWEELAGEAHEYVGEPSVGGES
jgi:protein required for attachment to host cells